MAWVDRLIERWFGAEIEARAQARAAELAAVSVRVDDSSGWD